jgi:hypothetical protein
MRSGILKLLLFLCASALLSCHSSKLLNKIADEHSKIDFDKINSDSVIKRITTNQNLIYFNAKGHISFTSKDEELNGNINVYLIKDSLYLAVIKKLGIELSRILITKDSFKILDRINQTYTSLSMDDIQAHQNIPIDFSSIHQMLTSGCFLDHDIYYEFKKSEKQCTLTGISEYQTLTYQLDTTMLLPRSFEAMYEHNSLALNIHKSTKFYGNWIPTQFDAIINNAERQIMEIQIKWDEIKLDPITAIKFNIPEHYSKESR